MIKRSGDTLRYFHPNISIPGSRNVFLRLVVLEPDRTIWTAESGSADGDTAFGVTVIQNLHRTIDTHISIETSATAQPEYSGSPDREYSCHSRMTHAPSTQDPFPEHSLVVELYPGHI